MDIGLLIASTSLAAVTLITIIVRRQREYRAGLRVARQHGWTVSARPTRYWRHLLRNVALFRVGHSRRIGHVLEAGEGVSLVPLVFDTGFGHRRNTHSLRVVVCACDHGAARATFTRQSWLAAAVRGPTAVELPLPRDDGEPASGLVVVVQDVEAWQSCLDGGLGRWMRRQPAERSWEVLPGLIVGHEPGGFTAGGLTSLAAAAIELRSWLPGGRVYDEGGVAESAVPGSATTGCELAASRGSTGREVAS